MKKVLETDKGILINGDAREVLKELPESSVDLIVTSPPYNVGIDYDNWNDNLPLDEYFAFLLDVFEGFKHVLKPDGRFALNVLLDSNMNGKRVSPYAEVYNLIRLSGLKFHGVVVLKEKSPERIKFTAWGSWLSASAPYIYTPLEVVVIGYNEVWKKMNKGKSTMTNKEFKEITSGEWEYRAETRGETKANFSLDIPLKAIKGLTYENDVVLDPFMGSGTTALACELTNRRWIGIEISPRYCEKAKVRLSREVKIMLPF